MLWHVLCALRVVRACHPWAPWWAHGARLSHSLHAAMSRDPPMRWAPSHVSSLPALDLTQPPTPQACASPPAHLDAHPRTDRRPRRRTRTHARTRMHTRTHARQTMASPCLRWRAPSARAASYLGGRVSYLVERGGPGAPMRDSSRPPSPGSRLGTSCAPCAWFVRATLGPRGEPVGVGDGTSPILF